jgi:membrane protein DedA with SNARE-associated domain
MEITGDITALLPDWLQTHGYWLLAIGCLLEGETVLLLAGFAAHRGRLDPFAVVAIAAAAGFAGDQIAFWLGRWQGAALLQCWPSIGAQTDRLHGLMQRWGAAMVIGVRFAYGLRLAGPVLMGMSPLPAWRFALFNAIGALLWALVIGGIGWIFGQAAESLLGRVQQFEGLLLVLLAAAALGWWWWRRVQLKRAQRRQP